MPGCRWYTLTVSEPNYSYDDLVIRARCGQHTLRQCLLVIEALKTHLQIAAALAEVTIPPESRTGAVGQYCEDFDYIFAVLDEVMPDAEKVCDLLWEGPSDFDVDQQSGVPFLQIIPGSKAALEGLHAELDQGKTLNDVGHLRLIGVPAGELELNTED